MHALALSDSTTNGRKFASTVRFIQFALLD
jgi:hypothetical protein